MLSAPILRLLNSSIKIWFRQLNPISTSHTAAAIYSQKYTISSVACATSFQNTFFLSFFFFDLLAETELC